MASLLVLITSISGITCEESFEMSFNRALRYELSRMEYITEPGFMNYIELISIEYATDQPERCAAALIFSDAKPWNAVIHLNCGNLLSWKDGATYPGLLNYLRRAPKLLAFFRCLHVSVKDEFSNGKVASAGEFPKFS